MGKPPPASSPLPTPHSGGCWLPIVSFSNTGGRLLLLASAEINCATSQLVITYSNISVWAWARTSCLLAVERICISQACYTEAQMVVCVFDCFLALSLKLPLHTWKGYDIMVLSPPAPKTCNVISQHAVPPHICYRAPSSYCNSDNSRVHSCTRLFR